MSGFLAVFAMSALLGAASFCVGILPLSFTFSSSALARLSTFGTGLLLGAALGVIIPEGIETLVSANTSSIFPTSAIALSLLTGFMFMLVVEQFLSPHSHDSPVLPPSPSAILSLPKPHQPVADIQFDVELGELERAEGIDITNAGAQANMDARALRRSDSPEATSRNRAYPLTLGLVMHALADGLALGSSALSAPAADPNTDGSILPSGLSLVVFLALAIHKAPTALALTTSLLSTSLPRSECKKHIAVFSAATPLGALLSYLLLSFFGASSEGRWPGVALLVSGGTFLYVATVLQPVSGGTEELGRRLRVLLTVLGMLTPFLVGNVLGHEHEHAV
ncbi:Zinc/iron permease [Amylocystis lapponica]|nr:Zinc/iron permease [Amylocystis lapponica]